MKVFFLVIFVCLALALPVLAVPRFSDQELPSEAIQAYLGAIQQSNWGTAYNQIHFPMTNGLSKSEWMLMMDSARRQTGYRMIEFEILKAEIKDGIAWVIARSLGKANEHEFIITGNYYLKLVEGNWRIFDLKEQVFWAEERKKFGELNRR